MTEDRSDEGIGLTDWLASGFLPMDSAPKDGAEIEILFRHMNWKYAGERDRSEWQQVCKAYWTDFNGGGWVWNGICGVPICWRPLANAETQWRKRAPASAASKLE